MRSRRRVRRRNRVSGPGRRELAERGQFPAIDVGASLSRLMPWVAGREHRAPAEKLRRLLAACRRAEELIAVGAHRKGHDALLDEAVGKMPAIERFLGQPFEHAERFEATLEQLAGCLGGATARDGRCPFGKPG